MYVTSYLSRRWLDRVSDVVRVRMISSSRTGSALPARSAPLLRRHPAPCGTGAQTVLYFGTCIELRDRPKTLAHPQALPSARNDLSGRAAPLRRIRANSKLLLGEEFALEEERLRHHALGGVAGHRSLTRPEGSIVPECSRAESGRPEGVGPVLCGLPSISNSGSSENFPSRTLLKGVF